MMVVVIGAATGAGGSLRVLIGLPSTWNAHRKGPCRQMKSRICRRSIRDKLNPPIRPDNDNYAKWDPVNRKKTSSYDQAEQILINTGLLPRPLRMSDVRMHGAPMKKSIVANVKELQAIAKRTGMYAITRLQARLVVKREFHTVWGHERILVFGKLLVQYLQPDVDTNEPLERELRLKFKAAFKEDADPFFPTKEAQWNKELEKRGLRPDVTEGKAIAKAIRGVNPVNEIPENVFCEAILDNVLDLGELVIQHFMCHIDKHATREKYVTGPTTKSSRLQKRMQKRLSKELGVNAKMDFKDDEKPENWVMPSPQSLHDEASKFLDWNHRVK